MELLQVNSLKELFRGVDLFWVAGHGAMKTKSF